MKTNTSNALRMAVLTASMHFSGTIGAGPWSLPSLKPIYASRGGRTKKPNRTNSRLPHQGKAECARRRRQMAGFYSPKQWDDFLEATQ